MNLIVDCEIVYGSGSAAESVSFDLGDSKVLFGLVVGFGNGIFDEMRVTGRTREALFYFVRMTQAGGFTQGSTSLASGKRLYQDGDACFPAEQPFVFLAPTTTEGDEIDFHDLESEIQRRTADLEKEALVKKEPKQNMRPLFEVKEEEKPWWKFW